MWPHLTTHKIFFIHEKVGGIHMQGFEGNINAGKQGSNNKGK